MQTLWSCSIKQTQRSSPFRRTSYCHCSMPLVVPPRKWHSWTLLMSWFFLSFLSLLSQSPSSQPWPRCLLSRSYCFESFSYILNWLLPSSHIISSVRSRARRLFDLWTRTWRLLLSGGRSAEAAQAAFCQAVQSHQLQVVLWVWVKVLGQREIMKAWEVGDLVRHQTTMHFVSC